MEEKEPLGRFISQLYRKGSSFVARELSQYGIGSGQVMFLLQLYRNDGVSQEELSEALNIDKGTTCRAIKKLEEDGFVSREKDEHDKRAYKICLTKKSKDIKIGIRKSLDEWDDMLSSNITKEERVVLVEILRKICVN